MDFKKRIDTNKIPKHIAIIMDGNGRWAKKQGMARIFGHRNALTSVRESVEAAQKSAPKRLHCTHFPQRTGTGQRQK